MSKHLRLGLGLLLCSLTALAVKDVASATEGTIEKIDATTKTIVVKTGEGAEHTFHFVDRTAVHGVKAMTEGGEATLHGLKEGSHVVVHYTAKGTRETASEIDNVGEDGLKTAEGTVKDIDRGGKKITVKTDDGTEETFRLTDRASKDAGKDIGEGAEKSAKVTVYYSEEGGDKVAHFFKKAF